MHEVRPWIRLAAWLCCEPFPASAENARWYPIIIRCMRLEDWNGHHALLWTSDPASLAKIKLHDTIIRRPTNSYNSGCLRSLVCLSPITTAFRVQSSTLQTSSGFNTFCPLPRSDILSAVGRGQGASCRPNLCWVVQSLRPRSLS